MRHTSENMSKKRQQNVGKSFFIVKKERDRHKLQTERDRERKNDREKEREMGHIFYKQEGPGGFNYVKISFTDRFIYNFYFT